MINVIELMTGEERNMKRIYAFTLDNDDYPSKKFGFDLRLLAYLLYDSVYNYDGDNFTALVINKNIMPNMIHDGQYPNEYYFDFDDYDEKNYNYEPFLLGDSSFAFTIEDTMMSEETLCSLFDYVLRLTGLNYKYKVNSNYYFSRSKDDEKNRKKTIDSLIDKIGCGHPKRNIFARKRTINNICNFTRMRCF